MIRSYKYNAGNSRNELIDEIRRTTEKLWISYSDDFEALIEIEYDESLDMFSLVFRSGKRSVSGRRISCSFYEDIIRKDLFLIRMIEELYPAFAP